MKLPIIYEDNHLLVVDKPVNMPSQKDESNDSDLQSLLKEHLKLKYDKPGNVFLALVHRLDRPVSGIMVLAKTSKAAARLSDQIRVRTFCKKYHAVVMGKCPPGGELVHYLKKDQKKNITSVVHPSAKNAKKAILSYSVIDYRKSFSLVEIDLITGRSHQVRVQFAAAGFPLWGDSKYGKPAHSYLNTSSKRKFSLALRAVEISFQHPVKNELMHFKVDHLTNEPWSLFF